MDELQEKKGVQSVFNNLAAIADAYSDSEVDSDEWSNTEIEETLVDKSNFDVQGSHVQLPVLHEDGDTTPKFVELAFPPEAGVISMHTDSIDSKEASGSLCMTNVPMKISKLGDINDNEPSKHLHQDAVYIMSIVGEELKSLETSTDVKQGEPAEGVLHQSEADSPAASSDDSDSSDDESSSSSDSVVEPCDIRERVVELEDLDEEKINTSPPRTKDELFLKDLPDEPELEIEVDESVQLIPIGEVESIIDALVVIHALPHTPALDSGSYLFLESREYLGTVFEIFGPVQSPYYSLRFNSEKSIENKHISRGMTVCYAPDVTDYSIFVFTEQLRKIKGSDASWRYDQEPPPQLIEYSDDEQEQQAKAKKKKEKKAKRDKETGESEQVSQSKQRKVGKWSWRNQQHSPSPSEASRLHPQGNSQACPVNMGPAAVLRGPPGFGPPAVRQGPPINVALLHAYPRGPPPTGAPLQPPQGPLQYPQIMPPHSRPFMDNQRHWSGPPFFQARFEQARPFSPHMVPYQHGLPPRAPQQYGPLNSRPIPPPPPPDHFNSPR